MIRILVILLFLFTVLTSHGFAQMGHGMMRGPHDVKPDMTEHHERMMGTDPGKFVNMSDMMSRMTEMMRVISDMSRNISPEKRQALSGIMRNMSSEMSRMSWVMETGSVTDEEMRDMSIRIDDLQRRMAEFKR